MGNIKGNVAMALALGGLWAGPASATGWTQPEGGYYAKAWGRLLTGNKFMTAGGEKR